MRREWTAKERQYILAHYGPQAGLARVPTAELARMYGVSKKAVQKAVIRWGGSRPPKKLSEARLRKLYAEGLDDVWIAHLMDTNKHKIWRWRKANGLPPNGRRGRRAGLLPKAR